jgi:hypothetical protein
MLKEWFEYITTPAPQYVRDMGYVSQVIATKARYGRHQVMWDKHLACTKEWVMKASDVATQKRKVLVLGAGNLYDVPLADLSRLFDEVLLVDIVFLRGAKKQACKFGNVSMHTMDITCMAEMLHAKDENAARAATPKMFLDDDEIDLVISCNIASQLPFNLLPYIADEDPHAQFDFCTEVIAKHMDYMAAFTCAKLTVTDVSFFVMEHGNVQTQRALCGVEVPELDAAWRWDIAPLGEVAENTKEWHEVGAVIL